MRVMVFVKATEDSEKGVLPTTEAFEAMDRFTEELPFSSHGRTPATASTESCF